MRATSPLITAIAMIGALFSSGLALAQPASTGETAIDPVDTSPGAGMNFTLGAGAGVAPDYEGSDDYQLVPLWNLRIGNLYHPSTFVQVIGPRLRSNFLPSDHWRLGLSGSSSRSVTTSRTIRSTTSRRSTRRRCSELSEATTSSPIHGSI